MQALPDTRSQHTASQALMVEQQALEQKIKFKRAETKQTQEELAACKVGCYTVEWLCSRASTTSARVWITHDTSHGPCLQCPLQVWLQPQALWHTTC